MWLKGKLGKFVQVCPDLSNFPRPLPAIIILTIASLSIIFALQFLSFLIYGAENYTQIWSRVVRRIPLWTKTYFILIAPFTAGIFEEAPWRWYGIENLEKHYTTKKAILTQAIAFGLWHGISLHTIATLLIGLLYGYYYTKKRRLMEIITAHITADIIGFTMAFWLIT